MLIHQLLVDVLFVCWFFVNYVAHKCSAIKEFNKPLSLHLVSPFHEFAGGVFYAVDIYTVIWLYNCCNVLNSNNNKSNETISESFPKVKERGKQLR